MNLRKSIVLIALLLGAVVSLAQSAPTQGSAQIGKQVTITVTAAGTQPFTYQWSKGTTPVPIAGATSVALIIANVQPADAGIYTVTVSNAAGSASAQGVLTVTPIPPAVTGLSFTVQ